MLPVPSKCRHFWDILRKNTILFETLPHISCRHGHAPRFLSIIYQCMVVMCSYYVWYQVSCLSVGHELVYWLLEVSRFVAAIYLIYLLFYRMLLGSRSVDCSDRRYFCHHLIIIFHYALTLQRKENVALVSPWKKTSGRKRIEKNVTFTRIQ